MNESSVSRLAVAGFAIAGGLILAGCNDARVDLPATVPPEPARVTASADGFEGEITIDGAIVSLPRLHETIEPRMRGALAEAQVRSQAYVRARGVGTAAGLYFKAAWTSAPAGDRYLDVHGVVSEYAGGAHPMTTVEAFVWDRLGQRRLALADLLTDPRPGSPGVIALAQAARDALIAVKRARMPDYDPGRDTFIGDGPGEPFAADLGKFARNFALVPPAADGRGGGLELYYSPYDVGSYAGGRYDVGGPAAVVAPLLTPEAGRAVE
ncbi:MAG: RsiV family protein [Steroidobacteraceae bacterium]